MHMSVPLRALAMVYQLPLTEDGYFALSVGAFKRSERIILYGRWTNQNQRLPALMADAGSGGPLLPYAESRRVLG